MENPPKDIKNVAIVATFILDKDNVERILSPLVISNNPFNSVLEKEFKLR